MHSFSGSHPWCGSRSFRNLGRDIELEAIVRFGRHPKPAPAADATRTAKWREFIDLMLGIDGYVVSASSDEMKTGSRASIWGSDQPFQIIGVARYEDVRRQWRVWEELAGEKMEPPARDLHFYKFGTRRE